MKYWCKSMAKADLAITFTQHVSGHLPLQQAKVSATPLYFYYHFFCLLSFEIILLIFSAAVIYFLLNKFEQVL